MCYEAGCFGYEPARGMQAMGAKVYVIAPQNWDEQGKGQVNDKHDAQVICRRLSEYLALASEGIEHRAHSLARGGGAAGARADARAIAAGVAAAPGDRAQPFVELGDGGERALVGGVELGRDPPGGAAVGHIAQLESWKRIIEAIEEQLGKIEAELRAAAPRKLIFGEGELTHELLARELIDPERFRNGRQVGNYFGLCPSESTSERATTDGLDHQARQSAPAPLDGRNGLAGNSLSAQLSGAPPVGSAAGRSQSLCRCPQESDRGPGASTGRRPLANRHRASAGPRTWAGLQSTAQLKNAHRRRNFTEKKKLSRPRRKTLWNGAPSTPPLSAIKELDL